MARSTKEFALRLGGLRLRLVDTKQHANETITFVYVPEIGQELNIELMRFLVNSKYKPDLEVDNGVPLRIKFRVPLKDIPIE